MYLKPYDKREVDPYAGPVFLMNGTEFEACWFRIVSRHTSDNDAEEISP
ncbi:MAG: hypothetical protein ACLRTQ_03470 [Candidatus Borkfalkia sp.]